MGNQKIIEKKTGYSAKIVFLLKLQLFDEETKDEINFNSANASTEE